MVNFGDLLKYYIARYKHRTGSIYLDGLVGGMFLAFLLDTSDSCDNKEFINVFFYIGLSHYANLVISDQMDFSRRAAAYDDEETWMENAIQSAFPWVLHIIRLVQYPLLCTLMYYVFAIQFVESAQYTHDREEEGKKFCEANSIHIAGVTVAFQLLYGLFIVISWTVLWAVDREDDAAEEEEEKAWREAEAKEKGTLWGNIKEFILVVGIQSFFDDQVSGTFLSLAIALPHVNCNIHVTEWFLLAGVVATLTTVVNDLREEVEELANLDGIINLVESRLIVGLRMVNFPLFVMELVTFVVISSLVFRHNNDIEFKRDPDEKDPHYCELGIWKLMVAVMVIYTALLLFRVAVLAGSLISDEKPEIQEQEKLSEIQEPKKPGIQEPKKLGIQEQEEL